MLYRFSKAHLMALALMALPGGGALAAGEAPIIPERDWSFEGILGVFDRAQLQRGFQVYQEVCSGCHGIRHVSYRDLAALGYSSEEIKEIAAQYEVWDGPDGEGDMFERPARPSDKFVPPFPNHNAARAANGGALPPDLSLMVKARKSGDDYLYALLTGYKEPPPEIVVPDGRYYNTAYPGFQIAMPPALESDLVEYADGAPATVSQMAQDVTTFLAWTAEPKMEERKRLGIKTMIFVFVLTLMLLAVKRKIWKNAE